jgi:hypothetical protein
MSGKLDAREHGMTATKLLTTAAMCAVLACPAQAHRSQSWHWRVEAL